MNKTLKCGCTAGLGYPFACPHGNDTDSAAAPTRSRPLTAKQKERVAAAGNAVRIDDLSGGAWDKIRVRIRERDAYTCQVCRRAVLAGIVDHKVALINGGTNADDNLQLLCEPCHQDKTNVDLGRRVRTGSTADGMPTSAGHHWNK
jgi:5-methylcytosine-specific restriction protein A